MSPSVLSRCPAARELQWPVCYNNKIIIVSCSYIIHVGTTIMTTHRLVRLNSKQDLTAPLRRLWCTPKSGCCSLCIFLDRAGSFPNWSFFSFRLIQTTLQNAIYARDCSYRTAARHYRPKSGTYIRLFVGGEGN